MRQDSAWTGRCRTPGLARRVTQEPVEDRVEVGRQEKPGETDQDDRRVDERQPHRFLLDTAQDGGELLAEQDEEQRLQQEDQHAPERDGLQPRRGIREDPRGPPALVEAVGDDGQDAGDV